MDFIRNRKNVSKSLMKNGIWFLIMSLSLLRLNNIFLKIKVEHTQYGECNEKKGGIVHNLMKGYYGIQYYMSSSLITEKNICLCERGIFQAP